ncbi:hypothetical protein [Saccharothrix xinjiangensis]|uniref:Uncharacterized protein n=1 Tax=Saccharothrix xinjiangensis TaxID=204798 RepID=A0ABV9Y3J8_9PSEU
MPLYSPSCSKSEVSGQEWRLFQRRLELHRRRTGKSPARILPVWCIPPHQPPTTAHLHDTRDEFDDDYRRHGLRYFMELKDNESRYQDFLLRFAREVVAAGDPTPPLLEGAVRDVLDAYGPTWEDWSPFRPGCPDPVLLREACPGNRVEGDARGFRQHLHTVEEFEDVLVQLLVDIRARLVNRAAVNRRVNGGRATRPVLTGPEG